MDILDPYIDWLIQYRYAVVFVASIIDATGLPFPGRIILVVAGTLVAVPRELVLLVVLGALGSVIGDHVLYLAGAIGGPRLLAMYCRVSLASERCVESTVAYFRRFGPAAVLLGRFSFGVRLFAAILAGSGHLPYRAFVGYDLLGSVVFVTLWLVLGHLFGAAVIERTRLARALLLVGPLAIIAVLLFRLIRRRRYGQASSEHLGPGPRASIGAREASDC
jgi:membrane protein DedA with SNARE-associated domain